MVQTNLETIQLIDWEMQANTKEAKRLRYIDDRDHGPSETFNIW